MHKHVFTFLSLFLAVLCSASIVSADAVEQFLQDVSFTYSGSGVTNAVRQIDARLAKGGLNNNDRTRILIKKASVLLGLKGQEERVTDLVDKEIFSKPDVSPKLKLEAYDTATRFNEEDSSGSLLDITRIRMLNNILQDPAVQKDPALTAAFEYRLAKRHDARLCHDLAVTHYLKAAELMANPAEKAKVLFAAAVAARKYRDMKTSSKCLDEIAKTPNIPYDAQKRALLIKGENAIFPNQYEWKPTLKNVATAQKYIDQALDDHSPLLGTMEAARVLYALIKAEAKAGDPKGAVKKGEELIEAPWMKKMGGYAVGPLAHIIARICDELKDYKRAVKYYEISLSEPGCNAKNIHKSIAASARAGQDFFRAMQAYGDAIKFCDPVEGKAEIEFLTGQIRQMNKTVRKGSAAVDSEAIFTDMNDDISGLTLDEE